METAQDPFDELTSLYLGAPPENPPARPLGGPAGHFQDDETPEKVQHRAGGVTIALCGHLPVMAGLWVTQYAEKVAAEHGPTGLVRLEGGRCLLEILRPDEGTMAFAEDRRPVDLAEHVMQLASGRIQRWIVCVDDRDAAASVRAGADEVVILTAADKPAVVEAYRLAKSAAARVADPESLELGLVLVGMDDDQAEKLSGRLAPVTARHLDRELPIRATVRRIDVVEGSVRQVFEEAARVPAEEIVESIIESLSVSDTTGLSPESDDWSAITPPTSAGPMLRIASDDALEELQQPIRLTPAPAEVEPRVLDHELSAAGLVEAVIGTPEVEVAAPSPAPVVEDSSDGGLARLLDLEPVDWRLPTASGVEYGCDGAGRLHLVARDGDVAGLHVAAAWIGGQQRQFAAVSGLPVESIGDPCLHVVTEHPPRVADLHRTGLHLHLQISGDSGPTLLPLNDERNRSMPD